jgi:ribosomal protein S18 acetylase RimI-like enzyme
VKIVLSTLVCQVALARLESTLEINKVKDFPLVVGVSLQKNPVTSADGLRPVNLRTDLAPLADLIELVFQDSMDSSGRAAIREMRYLSRLGLGLSLLSRMNELAQGISLGYVWIVDGHLVGNVSVYPANWPAGLGKAWIIANVGVHPDYQRQGIATRLMQASLEMIRQRGGDTAILQVDHDNDSAQHLYTRLGFRMERSWTTWRRNTSLRPPAPLSASSPNITRRRDSEWKAEYQLATQIRPEERGGLGWLRPLHISYFHKPLWRTFGEWLALRSVERLVIHEPDEQQIAASLWIENAVAATTTQLTLLVHPEYQGLYDEALIHLVTRRFNSAHTPLSIEHPADDETTSAILQRHHFRPQRTVIHMRWDARETIYAK